MEKELNTEWIKSKEKFENLPKKARWAINWLIRNWDFVTGICKESKITYEEIEKYKKEADEKEDYVLFVLLHVIEFYKNGNDETII